MKTINAPKTEFMNWLMAALEKERFYDLATVDFSVPKKREKDFNNLYYYILEKSKEQNFFSPKKSNPQLFFRYNGNYYLIHIKHEECRSYVYIRFFFKIPEYYIDLQPNLYQEEKEKLTCCILIYEGEENYTLTPEKENNFLMEARTRYLLDNKDKLITKKWINMANPTEKVLANKEFMIYSTKLYQTKIEKEYLYRYYKYACIGIVEENSLEIFKKILEKQKNSPFY